MRLENVLLISEKATRIHNSIYTCWRQLSKNHFIASFMSKLQVAAVGRIFSSAKSLGWLKKVYYFTTKNIKIDANYYSEKAEELRYSIHKKGKIKINLILTMISHFQTPTTPLSLCMLAQEQEDSYHQLRYVLCFCHMRKSECSHTVSNLPKKMIKIHSA